jgi:hypothetical protein
MTQTFYHIDKGINRSRMTVRKKINAVTGLAQRQLYDNPNRPSREGGFLFQKRRKSMATIPMTKGKPIHVPHLVRLYPVPKPAPKPAPKK